MSPAQRVVWGCLFLLLSATAWCGPIEHVIVVSLDGARGDAVLSAPATNLQAMAASGAYTWWAQTIAPSKTLVAHCSMLTGCQPDKHGTSFNQWMPAQGYVKANTCFELVKKSGGGTAMFVGKGKLRHIARPGTVDAYESVQGPPETVSAAAAAYFATNRPALMFVHYRHPDDAGHGSLWGSTQYLASITACDRGIGMLRAAVDQAGLASNTLFIVTADHGGHGGDHGTKDVRDMTIPWIAWRPGQVKPGEIQGSVSVCDTAATAVWALGLKPDPQWDGKPLVEIFLNRRAFGAGK